MEFLKKVESKGPLSCDTVLKIFYQTCRAVQHLHRQKPPIIHRDLKVGPRPCACARLPGSPSAPRLSPAGPQLGAATCGRGCGRSRARTPAWSREEAAPLGCSGQACCPPAAGRRAGALPAGLPRAPAAQGRLPFSSCCRRGTGLVVTTVCSGLTCVFAASAQSESSLFSYLGVVCLFAVACWLVFVHSQNSGFSVAHATAVLRGLWLHSNSSPASTEPGPRLSPRLRVAAGPSALRRLTW